MRYTFILAIPLIVIAIFLSKSDGRPSSYTQETPTPSILILPVIYKSSESVGTPTPTSQPTVTPKPNHPYIGQVECDAESEYIQICNPTSGDVDMGFYKVAGVDYLTDPPSPQYYNWPGSWNLVPGQCLMIYSGRISGEVLPPDSIWSTRGILGENGSERETVTLLTNTGVMDKIHESCCEWGCTPSGD